MLGPGEQAGREESPCLQCNNIHTVAKKENRAYQKHNEKTLVSAFQIRDIFLEDATFKLHILK